MYRAPKIVKLELSGVLSVSLTNQFFIVRLAGYTYMALLES